MRIICGAIILQANMVAMLAKRRDPRSPKKMALEIGNLEGYSKSKRQKNIFFSNRFEIPSRGIS